MKPWGLTCLRPKLYQQWIKTPFSSPSLRICLDDILEQLNPTIPNNHHVSPIYWTSETHLPNLLFHSVSHMTHQRSTPNFRPLKVDASRPWWQGCVEHRYLSASWHHPNGILWDPNVLRVLRVQKHQTSFRTRSIPMDANIPPENESQEEVRSFQGISSCSNRTVGLSIGSFETQCPL